MNKLNYPDLLDKADQMIEILLYDHIHRASDYTKHFANERPTPPFNQILPLTISAISVDAVAEITSMLNTVPITQWDRLMFLATNTIFPTCSNCGLISYITFKHLKFNNREHPFYSVFVIDGLVYDPLRHVAAVPLRAYIKRLYTRNERVIISRSYSSYMPSDLFEYYINTRQWVALTRRKGASREEFEYYGLDNRTVCTEDATDA